MLKQLLKPIGEAARQDVKSKDDNVIAAKGDDGYRAEGLRVLAAKSEQRRNQREEEEAMRREEQRLRDERTKDALLKIWRDYAKKRDGERKP